MSAMNVGHACTKAVLLGGLVAFTGTAAAQLTVNQQADPLQLAQTIAGAGVRIANPVIDCHVDGFGEFSYTGSLLGINEGIILTSGTVDNAIGPNNVSNKSFQQYRPGSALLDVVTGRTTHDACRFEFDVIPGGDSLHFDFVFASEEYNEWVGSQYNDVFGFFISGPGITGDAGIGSDHNIALIPNSTQAVTINNVNNGSNTVHYFDNAGGSQVQYDGITRNLQARTAVQPCQTYHLKLIVADASDRKLDSGVLIERIESNAVTMSATTVNGMANMVEGCNAGTIRFTRQNVTAQALDVPYFLAGSAVNGADYPLHGSDPDPLVAKTATIPSNASSVDVVIDPIADGTVEGTEDVKVYLGISTCPYYLDSLTFGIQDSLYATVNAPAPICAGGQVQLTASGGLSYAWNPASDLNNAAIADPMASPSSTSNYSVTVSAGACMETLSTVVTVSSIALSDGTTAPLCNGGNNGILNLDVSGGVAPYSFAWIGPNGFSAASEDLVNIAAGTYTVSVSDGASCSHVQSFNVSAPQALSATLAPSILAFGQNIACFGGSTGSINLSIAGGTGPYSTAWSGPNGYTSAIEDIANLSAGNYDVLVTDANGCTATAGFNMTQPDALQPTVTSVQQITCFGANNGSATAGITGGMPPYSYDWNTTPVQNSASVSGLEPGSYTVIITDGYGCSSSGNVTITEPQALGVSLTSTSDILNCQGQAQQDGTATAVAAGGTGPYSYEWNTTPAQNTATATFSTSGNYNATLTDANGCTATTEINISQPGAANASILSQANVICFGNDIGSATIEITGGASLTSIEWNTVPAQIGATASGLAAGTYTATAQHADGCQTSIDVTIDGPTSALAVAIDPGITNELCAGDFNGSATATASGGGAPYTYGWNTSPVQTSATASNLTAGTWNVVVTDAFGCTAQADAVIGGPSQPLSVAITDHRNVLCSGAAQGSATAEGSGGTPAYSYVWDCTPPQTGPNAVDLVAGTYTVTATDANGCTATTSVNILGPNDEMEATIEDFTNVSCFGGSDGSATISAIGGSNSFSYLWNTVPPQTGPTATGLAAGIYLVAISDNNGCDTTKYVPVSINGPATALVMDVAITGMRCGDVEDGAADVTLSGGQAPYTYQWSDSFGNHTGIEDVTGLGAGDYFLHVFDAFGCALDTSFSLTEPAPITLQATVAAVPCQGSTTGSIDAVAGGGTGTIVIAWSGPNGFTANTASISNLEAGDYILTLTDDNACALADTFSVFVSAPPQLSTLISNHNGVPISCSGAADGAIDLTILGGTAPFTIDWTNGLGFSSAQEDIDSLTAGGYQVTVSDALGCTSDTLVVLNAPTSISIASVLGSTNGNNITCFGGNDGSIDLTVSGGTAPFLFAWTSGDTTEDLASGSAGAQSVTITDANGCTTSGNWTLTEPAPIGIAASVFAHSNGFGISCATQADGAIDALISGGTAPHTIAWIGPNGFSSNSASISGIVAGAYTISITDANGCVNDTTVNVTEPSAITAQLTATTYNAGTNISCAGGSNGAIQSAVNGGIPGYQLSWSGPNGYTSTDALIQNIVAGPYSLMITDASGCQHTVSTTLTEPQPLDVTALLSDAGAGFQVGCAGNDGFIDLSIVGGTPQYAIGWSGPNGFGSMNEGINGLAAGDYMLEVMDANGCVSNDTITLLAPSAAQLSYVVNGTDCSGSPNGSIDVTINAGATPVTFVWTGPNGFNSTNEDLSNLANGDYIATITDAAGCVSTHTETISGPTPLTAGAYLSFYGIYNLQCQGDSTGVIELDPQGGNGPFAVNVSGPGGYASSNFDHTALVAGDYQISITDALGCSLDTVITLSEPGTSIDATLSVSLYPSGTNVSCFGSSDGSIDATINGGFGPFTFLWRGPDSTEFATEDITGLPAGTYAYELVVTDANQCSFFTNVILTQPDAPLANSFTISQYNDNNISCAGMNDGSIDATVVGGSPGYAVTWNGPAGFNANNEDIANLIAGTYTFTVTDTNGCTLSTPVDLVAPQALSAALDAPLTVGGTNISCFGANDGDISASVSGGTQNYVLVWTGPNGFASDQQQISNLAPGDYCLTVTDANGCTAQNCITLTEPELLAASTTTQPANCGASVGSADLSVTGGSTPYSFLWDNGAMLEDISGLPANSYGVTITDVNGCSVNTTATVTGTPDVDGNAAVTDNLCNGASEGAIDLNVLTGTAPYSYMWSDGNTDEDRTALVAGTYSIEVSDANGCTWNEVLTINESTPITIDSTLSVYEGGYNVGSYGGSNGSIEIDVSGGSPPYDIHWSNGATGTTLYGLSAGSYVVTITDVNGCSTVRTIILTEPQDLDMPTGYTPNGDGSNDLFVVHGLDAYPTNTFTVLNRWGSVVYDRFNYTNDWAGENSTGEQLPNGTYFVILTINQGTRTLQGYVDLRR